MLVGLRFAVLLSLCCNGRSITKSVVDVEHYGIIKSISGSYIVSTSLARGSILNNGGRGRCRPVQQQYIPFAKGAPEIRQCRPDL